MDTASLYYLGLTILLFLIFAAIVARTYRSNAKERGEEPKYRMMHDELPRKKHRPQLPRSRRGGKPDPD